MAACGRGLSRAMGASPFSAWRQAHSYTRGRLKPEYDAVVIGAGHNGLVAAAYLQRLGVNTAVFERRHVIGGAAVTEEIIPGFKFSRASYLLSLLRPQIYTELELKKHGLRLHLRNPHSFTPMLEESAGSKVPRSLLLGTDMAENQKQIAQFSRKDAEREIEGRRALFQAFPKYEAFMSRLALAIDPLLDAAPADVEAFWRGSLLQRLKSLSTLKPLLQAGRIVGARLPQYYQVLTAPIAKVRGSPDTGRTSQCGSLSSQGQQSSAGGIRDEEATVAKVQVSHGGRVQGVVLQDGSEVRSRVVLSNASPQTTFLKLTPQEWLPEEFVQRISQLDIQSPVTKINVAVNRLPDFLAAPNTPGGQPLPHHQCTIHLNCEDTLLLHRAYEDAMDGLPSHRPIIELCIPSSLDPTLAPPGCHVISLFTQYTPYTLSGGKAWDELERNAYADRVFDCIEAYAPGFKGSVVGRDVLTPPDLERIFGLPGGNVFHCAMALDQLYFARPVPLHSSYRSPLQGLYLCGSGAHPGGGVMGAAGRNAAHVVFRDLRSM
ncbi:Pyridine nucleotide-disulfide oxidoreductase domain-containing protein 2 [Camelus dromedarius]|uniref:Pyridine nucleotide-disulfide oxidoreductase domain-containing protein 2 n=1 Tax=Camelus dromedarius TaxID=9838 RepID=A0A5N4DJK9_CAMDR|nr:Pyridine nucleotide-disulfide oxidoreductase domain-containing protein 2 [Camelus dromedarius]